MNHKRALATSIVTPLTFAITGNAFVGDAMKTWYPNLKKSRLVLPTWIFFPIWIAYYLMCGALLYRLLAVVAPSRVRTQALALLLSMMAGMYVRTISSVHKENESNSFCSRFWPSEDSKEVHTRPWRWRKSARPQ